MDHADTGAAALGAARDYDRYAHWPRGLARIGLAVLAVLLVLAAWAPGYAPPPPAPPKVAVTHPHGAVTVTDDDNDLRLYRLIIARVAQGDDYYVAATEEQRRNNYPVAPGFTVRPPTLAWLYAALGLNAMVALEMLLFGAMLWANLQRLKAEPGGERWAPMALALLMIGIASGLNYKYAVLHEIWAAQLMALSFGLHRPARQDGEPGLWLGAVLAAGAALAVRELALPFVLLMAAWAGWHRRWTELAAWTALIALFAVALGIHYHLAEAQIRPGDPMSPPWLVFSGLAGWLYKINNSTFLSLLPVWLSGPVAVLCVFGWTGWRTRMGAFAALLVLGYALAFMIAGRSNNFYWGILITPILFMGAAFLPVALPSLCKRALGGAPRPGPAAAVPAAPALG
ncbi:MAG: hypothetical protein V4579_12280 [Pseudomonadota bacterium]